MKGNMKETLKKWVTDVYMVTFYIMYFLAVIEVIVDIVILGNAGQVGSAIFMTLFFWLISAVRAFLGTVIWGTIANIALIIPKVIYELIKE